MIHYFNPGHETDVLHDSKYYQAAANQVKMQRELAFLPAWYADNSDFVLTENPLPSDFISNLQVFKNIPQAIRLSDFTENKSILSNQSVNLWGISPSSVHLFEKLNKQFNLDLKIPAWKEEYRQLGNRLNSQKVLSEIIHSIPEIETNILPVFHSDLDAIEQYHIQSKNKQIVKSPFSSSGRGLVWLPPGEIARSEKQIISGMLKKQSKVSIEMALEKQLDFSMHFQTTSQKEVQFLGFSIFKTNTKGAYEKSFLAAQSELEKQITLYVNKELLYSVRDKLISIIEETYLPYYCGNIGVDMLIYKSENQYKLNPCIEINMRKSMGYLALELQKKFLHPTSLGEFYIDYNSNSNEIYQKHENWTKQFPLLMENNLIKSGYLSLCPVNQTSNYHAYIQVSHPHLEVPQEVQAKQPS